MEKLKKLIEKIFYFFTGGLIVEILMIESLKSAFTFSIVFGGILLILFLIYKFAEVWEWVEVIKDFLEDIIEAIENFIENVIDWFKEVFRI